jgi:hypothetical protein
MIFVGAILMAIGAFWATLKANRDRIQSGIERTAFEKELRIKSEQLQAKSEEIAQLSKEITKQNVFIRESFTGGDSFCYLFFANGPDDTIVPSIRHKGKYPLYDITFRLINLDSWHEGKKEDNEEKANASIRRYNFGNLGPGAWLSLYEDRFGIPDKALVRMKADINARNGIFIEMIHARKVNKHWQFAIRVFRFHDSKVLFEEIPEAFPRDENGNYDWNAES